MNVLVLGTDKNAFISGSETEKRFKKYSELVSELNFIIKTSKNDGYGFKDFNNLKLHPTNNRLKFLFLLSFLAIGRRVLKNSEDFLISSQDPFECGLMAYFLARRKKLPLHIQVHTDFMNEAFRKESTINSIRFFIGKFVLRRATEIRVVSSRIKDSIISLGIHPEKISVLPIWTDEKSFHNTASNFNLKEKYKNFDYIILMASRIEVEKNFKLALEVLNEIMKNGGVSGNSKILLLIVGDGSLKINLDKKIRELNLYNNVVIEKWTNDLTPYYKGADLLLLTSNYEGFGRTIIEAMASGCPVISTDVGVAKEVGAEIIPYEPIEASMAVLRQLKTHSRIKKFKNPYSLTSKEYLDKYLESWSKCFKFR